MKKLIVDILYYINEYLLVPLFFLTFILMISLFVNIKYILDKKKQKNSYIYKNKHIKIIDEKEPYVIFIDNDGEKILLDYSFSAKLYQAPMKVKVLYKELKEFLINYNEIKLLSSWKHERYLFKLKEVIKVSIKQDKLIIYLDESLVKNAGMNNVDLANSENEVFTYTINTRKELNYLLLNLEKVFITTSTKYEERITFSRYEFIETNKLIKMKLVKVV